MAEQDSGTPSTEAQRSLADHCEYLPDGSYRPCYALAGLAEPPCGLLYFGRPAGKRAFARASR